MSTCRLDLLNQGAATVPRTCPTCGLFGRCANGLDNRAPDPYPDYLSGMRAARMSQVDVAEKIGMSRQYVNDIVKGRRLPPAGTAKALLDAIEADARVRRFCVDRWNPEIRTWETMLSPLPIQEGSRP